MEIECEVEDATVEGCDGVVVTCGECGHAEESRGTGGGSVRRCLALLRENCPEGAKAFYVPDEERPD